MNYCIYLKKKKNKPFCKILNKEIAFSQCRECVNKEYKKGTENLKNSAKHYYKKAILHNKSAKSSNNHQINKKSGLKEKSPLKSGRLKNKSNKLAKLERNRFSVFTDGKQCFVCKSTYQLTWNEIFRGRNRLKSMKYGFCLRMCLKCHSEKQENIEFNDFWHRQAQLYFEKNIGSREDFLAEFRRNYLK